MVTGITFDKQLLTSRQHAHFYNLFLGHTDGVTKGCEITRTDSNVYIGKGFFVACGRFVEITGTEAVEMPTVVSGQLYCRTVFTIDLTQENTETEFRQGYFETLTSASSYPGLTQDDLDDDGTIYQMPFAQYIKTPTSVSSFVDQRPIYDLDSVWKAIAGNNEEYAAEFDEYYEECREEILQMIDDLKNEGFVTVSDARKCVEVTLSASDWSGTSSPYTQEVTVNGVTEDTVFTPGILYPDNCSRSDQKAINKAAGLLFSIVTSANKVTFSATERPTADIPLGLQGVI